MVSLYKIEDESLALGVTEAHEARLADKKK
jgi:hypothetical protein